ncbi:MAG: tRNA (pseudouridine(54)-N(1))-methyltransferase TrmY [Halobacteriales archaeon]
MRQFIVLGHRAPTTPEFDLDDLAGGAGRLDVLCRCVNAAFFLSHGIRDSVRLFLVLQDELTIRLEGSELRYLNPDERNIGSMLRNGIEAAGEAIGHQEVESSPGIYGSSRDLKTILEAIDSDAYIQLHERGEPIVDAEPTSDSVFVLADHESFREPESALLAEHGVDRIRVGPTPIHANHAIAVTHNFLDTDGYTTY